jgi:tRNA threonylcarbamoyladenosine biosynthesis protein TsaE
MLPDFRGRLGTRRVIEIVSTCLDDTVALGRRLGQLAQPGDVIGLDGELGAGKTQLVRGLAQGLGLDPAQVSSPTFVLLHEYPPEESNSEDATALLHLDAYRLTGPDDLAGLGFDEDLRADAVTAIEWASRIEEALGDNALRVEIEHLDEHKRRITLRPHGSWQRKLQDGFPT